MRLFNKMGRRIENPPYPHRWPEILHAIVKWDISFTGRTTIYNDLARTQSFVRATVVANTDQAIYGVSEYWAHAGQTLDRGVGDCEDHAILKWAYLNAMGYSPWHFAITVVYHEKLREGHAVLVYMSENGHVVLDNLASDIYYDHDQRWYSPRYAYGYNQNWAF